MDRFVSPLQKLVAELAYIKFQQSAAQSVAFVSSLQCQKSFDELKWRVIVASILAYADFSLLYSWMPVTVGWELPAPKTR